MRLVETLYVAVSQALPERVPAGSKGMIGHVGFGGRNPRDGELFAFLETVAGGFGGRASSDGRTPSSRTPRTPRTRRSRRPRLNYPVRILRYELIEDSEGPGTYRGGLGLRRDYTFEDDVSFTILADRDKTGPSGAFGATTAARRSTSSSARRRASGRRRPSTSSLATSKAAAMVPAAAGTARLRSGIRSASRATCERER